MSTARGERGWVATYQTQFGASRWKKLFAALKKKPRQVCLINGFLPQEEREELIGTHNLEPSPLINGAFVLKKKSRTATGESTATTSPSTSMSPNEANSASSATPSAPPALPPKPVELPPRQLELVPAHKFGGKCLLADTTAHSAADSCALRGQFFSGKLDPGILTYYALDGASVWAAQALGPFSGSEAVLDLCAAPGGKSIALAEMLFKASSGSSAPTTPLLVANEISTPRYNRLSSLLKSWLPPNIFQTAVRVVSADGTDPLQTSKLTDKLGIPTFFDKILVDAPCSTDRHLLENPTEMAHWSAKKTPKQNADRQLQLLRTAAFLLKVGGEMVYSTCALSHEENGGLIQRAIALVGEYGIQLEVVELPAVVVEGAGGGGSAAVAEERVAETGGAARPPADTGRGLGRLYLPDEPHGYGPLYVAKLVKRKGVVGKPPVGA